MAIQRPINFIRVTPSPPDIIIQGFRKNHKGEVYGLTAEALALDGKEENVEAAIEQVIQAMDTKYGTTSYPT